jgi:hypothetical protein
VQTSDANPRKSQANIESFVNLNVHRPAGGVDAKAVSARQRHCPAKACVAVPRTVPISNFCRVPNMHVDAPNRLAPMQMPQKTKGFDEMSRSAEMPAMVR